MTTFNITTKKTIEHECVFNRFKFIKLLREAGFKNVPDDAKITITVPGGGDYSNMTLDIDDMPVTVKYTTEEE